MLAIYISFIFIGLIIEVLGIVLLTLGFNGKEIIRFPLITGEEEFEIVKKGRYGVFLVGTKSLREKGKFSVHLKEKNTQTSIEVKECKIKFSTDTIKVKMLEFFQFEIPFPGKYRIEFENINQLQGSSRIKGGDRRQYVTGEHLEILIKKTLPVGIKFLSFLLLCLGFFLFACGIAFTTTPPNF